MQRSDGCWGKGADRIFCRGGVYVSFILFVLYLVCPGGVGGRLVLVVSTTVVPLLLCTYSTRRRETLASAALRMTRSTVSFGDSTKAHSVTVIAGTSR